MANQDPNVDNDRRELTEFTLCPRLPASVRQQIWSIAASFAGRPTPSMPGICIFDPANPIFTDRHHCTSRPPKLLVHELYPRTLLSVDTEAHDIALMSGECSRDYDPEVDILYISSRALYPFVSRECSRRRRYLSKTRHLAFPAVIQNLFTYSPNIFQKVRSLETITVVFPNCAEKTVARLEEDESPLEEQQLMRMKGLTVEELKSMETRTEYAFRESMGMYYADTPSGMPMMPVGGNVYRDEPSTAFQRTVNEACSPDRETKWRPLSPLWDYGKDGLGVRWQAGTLEPWPKRTRFVDRVTKLTEEVSPQVEKHCSTGNQTGPQKTRDSTTRARSEGFSKIYAMTG